MSRAGGVIIDRARVVWWKSFRPSSLSGYCLEENRHRSHCTNTALFSEILSPNYSLWHRNTLLRCLQTYLTDNKRWELPPEVQFCLRLLLNNQKCNSYSIKAVVVLLCSEPRCGLSLQSNCSARTKTHLTLCDQLCFQLQSSSEKLNSSDSQSRCSIRCFFRCPFTTVFMHHLLHLV